MEFFNAFKNYLDTQQPPVPIKDVTYMTVYNYFYGIKDNYAPSSLFSMSCGIRKTLSV